MTFTTLPPTASQAGFGRTITDPTADPDAPLRVASQNLEAAFLSEMLGQAGLGEPRSSFGGGAGEEQFGSFLREAQAKQLVRTGGIGLAETLFQAMKGRTDG